MVKPHDAAAGQSEHHRPVGERRQLASLCVGLVSTGRRTWTNCEAKDRPGVTTVHPIFSIESSCFINKDRPGRLEFFHVKPGAGFRFEGDYQDRDFGRVEFRLVLPQLRQVLLARQSSKMPVEHQQEPSSLIRPQIVDRAQNAGECEGWSRSTDKAASVARH